MNRADAQRVRQQLDSTDFMLSGAIFSAAATGGTSLRSYVGNSFIGPV
jgi:hypothetical protein